MHKATDIIISDEQCNLGNLGFYPQETDAVVQVGKHKIRRIFLQREGISAIPLETLSNIRNSQIERIIGPNGEIIFEITKKDIEEKNSKAQIFFGLMGLSQKIHTDDYNQGDCSNLLHILSGIPDIFIPGEKVNFEKFKVTFLHPLSKNRGDFNVGDIIALCYGSNLQKKDINKNTNEIDNPEIVFDEPHFAVYIGGGFFISKYGKFQKFCIGTLEELISLYPDNHTFLLEQKKLNDSIYIQELEEA